MGTSLPAELIVRDRRYYAEDIEAHCRDSGLQVIWSRFVRGIRAQSTRGKALKTRLSPFVLGVKRQAVSRGFVGFDPDV